MRTRSDQEVGVEDTLEVVADAFETDDDDDEDEDDDDEACFMENLHRQVI